jgi:hypothetical protein
MTADIFLSLKQNDRRTRLARDNGGGKSGCTRADHYDIYVAIPLGRNLRSLSGRRIYGSNVASRQCRYATR